MDVDAPTERQARLMSRYVLSHRHEAHECGVVLASFKGHESPLSRRTTLASCRAGGHAIWWTVDAESEAEALGKLWSPSGRAVSVLLGVSPVN